MTAPAFAAEPVRVVNEGGIKTAWALPPGTRLPAPVYPPQFSDRALEVCVGVGYLLNADGSTSHYALLKAWNSASGQREPSPGFWAAFAQSAADALQHWRFQPRPETGRPVPVYTVATMLFGKPETTASPQLRQRCAIPNLAQHLIAIRADSSKRRLLDTDLFDRMQLEPEDFKTRPH
ncbi:energy transducer TonB [Luteimonas sp. SX5]|uniref:Energy transducer TonB n=1 Tax=Luteimonas galliterrae TaxID=2940486 RepID=A0ABT0MKI8_9GAMM|nr:energy transducer TonB [Luteimonas galliterrae]MCL1635391.1 energy transducer TonB [Luteimonas galliterrae]